MGDNTLSKCFGFDSGDPRSLHSQSSDRSTPTDNTHTHTTFAQTDVFHRESGKLDTLRSELCEKVQEASDQLRVFRSYLKSYNEYLENMTTVNIKINNDQINTYQEYLGKIEKIAQKDSISIQRLEQEKLRLTSGNEMLNQYIKEIKCFIDTVKEVCKAEEKISAMKNRIEKSFRKDSHSGTLKQASKLCDSVKSVQKLIKNGKIDIIHLKKAIFSLNNEYEQIINNEEYLTFIENQRIQLKNEIIESIKDLKKDFGEISFASTNSGEESSMEKYQRDCLALPGKIQQTLASDEISIDDLEKYKNQLEELPKELRRVQKIIEFHEKYPDAETVLQSFQPKEHFLKSYQKYCQIERELIEQYEGEMTDPEFEEWCEVRQKHLQKLIDESYLCMRCYPQALLEGRIKMPANDFMYMEKRILANEKFIGVEMQCMAGCYFYLTKNPYLLKPSVNRYGCANKILDYPISHPKYNEKTSIRKRCTGIVGNSFDEMIEYGPEGDLRCRAKSLLNVTGDCVPKSEEGYIDVLEYKSIDDIYPFFEGMVITGEVTADYDTKEIIFHKSMDELMEEVAHRELMDEEKFRKEIQEKFDALDIPIDWDGWKKMIEKPVDKGIAWKPKKQGLSYIYVFSEKEDSNALPISRPPSPGCDY